MTGFIVAIIVWHMLEGREQARTRVERAPRAELPEAKT